MPSKRYSLLCHMAVSHMLKQNEQHAAPPPCVSRNGCARHIMQIIQLIYDTQNEARDTPSKMALAGEVHLAVRGLDDVGAWVRRIGERQQMP